MELCNREEVEKLFNNYEAKLSGQMVKSLGHSIIYICIQWELVQR